MIINDALFLTASPEEMKQLKIDNKQNCTIIRRWDGKQIDIINTVVNQYFIRPYSILSTQPKFGHPCCICSSRLLARNVCLSSRKVLLEIATSRLCCEKKNGWRTLRQGWRLRCFKTEGIV